MCFVAAQDVGGAVLGFLERCGEDIVLVKNQTCRLLRQGSLVVGFINGMDGRIENVSFLYGLSFAPVACVRDEAEGL